MNGSAAGCGEALFTSRYAVRFSHCDPAGIVFFPQYFVLLNGLIEDWFNEALGLDFAALIGKRRVGLPTVSLQCEFVAPSHMGEQIDFRLRVERLGARSITLDVGCSGADRLRLQLRQVLVTTSLDEGRSIDIPLDVRNAITRWQSSPGAH